MGGGRLALAASFDAMLERRQDAARLQQELVEETSHELRVPLAVLVTNAEVLLAHPGPTVAPYREGLERSLRSAERLRRSLDELLLAARRRARTIDRRPADLVRLAEEVVAEAEVVAAAKQIRLPVTGPASAPCRIDPPTVSRAVANLVDNAIRYAPVGTTVEVGIEVAGQKVHYRGMAEVGLAPAGDLNAVRWIAIRRATNHVHILATLVRQDGRAAWTR